MFDTSPVEWTVFAATVAVLLIVDITIASRGERRHSLRKAWIWSAIWIVVALLFGVWITIRLGSDAGLLYLTAYVLEKSLSIDILVVFALVFSQTGVPSALQHRALFWGVIGALVMRAVLIAFGIYALERFGWLAYPFGALLLYAAARMLKGEQQQRLWVESACSLCTSWVSRFIPITPNLHGERFTVRIEGKRYATPLLVALVAIESADLVFAVDSIPAVFAVTRDPFLVYTSNVFALLGLRSLYAVLGHLVARFAYLRIGLAVLLVFVALKLLISNVLHISAGVSLLLIFTIFGAAIAASIFLPNPKRPKESSMTSCSHRGEMKITQPSTNVCAQCVASGDTWMHLRMCMSCGAVGCCDDSKNKHATAHFHQTHHPIICSIETGEDWRWCYVDRTVVD